MKVLSPLGATSDAVESLARRRPEHFSVVATFGATRMVTIALQG